MINNSCFIKPIPHDCWLGIDFLNGKYIGDFIERVILNEDKM